MCVFLQIMNIKCLCSDSLVGYGNECVVLYMSHQAIVLLNRDRTLGLEIPNQSHLTRIYCHYLLIDGFMRQF